MTGMGVNITEISSIANPDNLNNLQTNIPHNSTNNSYHIYPNPSSGIFFIKTEKQDFNIISVEIFNLLGEKTNYFQFESDSKLDLNLSNNPSGIYFAKINIDGQVIIEKILLRKE